MYVQPVKPASRGHVDQVSWPWDLSSTAIAPLVFLCARSREPTACKLESSLLRVCKAFHSQGHCCWNLTQWQSLALPVRSCGCPYSQLLDGWTVNHLSCSEVFLSAEFNSLPCLDLFLQRKLSGLTAWFQMSLLLHFYMGFHWLLPTLSGLSTAPVLHVSGLSQAESRTLICDFLQPRNCLCCCTKMATTFSSSSLWFSCW